MQQSLLNELNISEASSEDLSEILDLYAQPTIDDGCKLAESDARKIFQRISTYPNYKIYTAKYNGTVVGTFALLIMDNLGHVGSPSGIVEDVAVSPEFQSRGFGKKMMLFALNKCREAGCYKVALSSNLIRENAHKFYESLGFKKHGYSFSVEMKG